MGATNRFFDRINSVIQEKMRKRDNFSWLFLFPIVSVLLGVLASGLMILLLHMNPISVFWDTLKYTFGDYYSIAEIFVKATPLILSGLAFAFAFRGGLFNIGAQGQFYIGVVLAVTISLKVTHLPGAIVMLIAMLVSSVFGGLWGAFAGYAKAKFNSNEFLITMMSTYVATNVLNYFLNGPLQETAKFYPRTDSIPTSTNLPILIPNTRLHYGFILALLIALLSYFILWRTTIGYKIRTVGLNKNASQYAGMNIGMVYVITMFIAGAFAGLAGFTEVNGVQHMAMQGFYSSVGSDGIAVALLGSANPIGVVLSAVLVGFLQVAGTIMLQTSRVPSSIINVTEGFVIMFVIISFFVQDRISATSRKREVLAKRKSEGQEAS